MRRWLEAFEEFAIDVILERRYGKRAALLRWLLYGLSWLFRGGVQTRLWLYKNRLLHERPPGCIVISIGNLTVTEARVLVEEDRLVGRERSFRHGRGAVGEQVEQRVVLGTGMQ